MKSIILFTPYFGKIPSIYEAWKITAHHNETIQFVLVTDDRSVHSEKNIRVIHMEWSDFVKKVQSRFSFPIALKKPYKICDFKPALGEVFSDDIAGYDLWGYCDFDLLLGDIRSFLTEDVIQKYDRFFYLGHICIYKNCEKLNSLYRYIEDAGYPAVNYEECYRSPRSFYFDEYGAMYVKCLINGVKVFDDLSIYRDPIIAQPKFYWKTVDDDSQFLISWENGKLYSVHKNKKEELLYAHFFRRKIHVPAKPDAVNRIVIVPTELRYNSDITEADFSKAEAGKYSRQYFINALRGTLKRNGIRGTLEKRKRDRDYWSYRHKMEGRFLQK